MVQFSNREKEHKLGINITTVGLKSEATGISERLMNTIHKRGKRSIEKEELCFSTPKEEKKNVKKLIVNAYNVISCGHVSLCKRLQEIGFKWT